MLGTQLQICFLENHVSEVSDCYSVLFAVHGVEYAFGAHDYPTSGVFEVEPRQCPGFRFRRSILLGTTRLDPIQVRQFMELQSVNYNGDTYHLITKNCNHLCKDMCYKLTGNKIPKWVNRLARIGIVAFYLH
jgi:deubiquitinase DESI2